MSFFFFNDTATTEIYTLSLHDALPISRRRHLYLARLPLQMRLLHDQHPQPHQQRRRRLERRQRHDAVLEPGVHAQDLRRSEEHTSELQSQSNLVCRLLLEKKKRLRIVPSCDFSSTSLPCMIQIILLL